LAEKSKTTFQLEAVDALDRARVKGVGLLLLFGLSVAGVEVVVVLHNFFSTLLLSIQQMKRAESSLVRRSVPPYLHPTEGIR